MKTKWLPSIISALLIIVFLFTLMQQPAPSMPVPDKEQLLIAQGVGIDLTADKMRAEALIDSLPVTEVLGSLAPIALSPFFALTCLSGASLLAGEGLLPESVSSNYLLGANSPLHNETVFLGLLALTVITSLPKLTKVSKPFMQAVDQVEAYSGIVAALAVQILSRVGDVDAPLDNEVAMVYSAGIITASYSTLLMIFSVINIFVVNSVKFFFEMMILISPFPTVDAFFEAANKAFTGFLIAVYLFSPWLATWLNLIIFLISLVIFSWTYRRVIFMKSVISDPFFGWFAETVFGMRKMSATSTKLPGKLEERFEGATIVLKAFPGKRMKGVAKKARGFFIQHESKCYFVKPRLIRSDTVVELGGEDAYAELATGIFSHRITFVSRGGETLSKVLFTKRYNHALPAIEKALNARAESASAKDGESLVGVGKGIANSIKTADKSSLRSEFA